MPPKEATPEKLELISAAGFAFIAVHYCCFILFATGVLILQQGIGFEQLTWLDVKLFFVLTLVPLAHIAVIWLCIYCITEILTKPTNLVEYIWEHANLIE